jgi:hypothetical protein
MDLGQLKALMPVIAKTQFRRSPPLNWRLVGLFDVMEK